MLRCHATRVVPSGFLPMQSARELNSREAYRNAGPLIRRYQSMTMRLLCLFLSLISPVVVIAQAVPAETLEMESARSRWSIGVGVGVGDGHYAGEGTRVMFLPMIGYEGDRFFLRGLGGGFHFLRTDTFSLDGLVRAQPGAFDVSDLSDAALARNGVDASLLEDRDDFGVAAGLGTDWRLPFGELKFQAVTDATGNDRGQELSIDYVYPLPMGGLMLMPSIGVRWLSADATRYLYGTLDEDEARGVAPYHPGSALLPQVRLGIMRPLSSKWQLFGGAGYTFLPSKISDSPLLEPGNSGSINFQIGINRRF